MFRLSADFVEEDNSDILTLNTKAQKLATAFEFSLRPNALQFEADTRKYGDCAAVVKEGIEQGVKNTAEKMLADPKIAFNQINKHDFNSETLFPTVVLWQLLRGAVDHEVTSQYIEFGYDPDELLEILNLKTEQKVEMLKPIESKFKDDSSQPLQLIIDQNAFNAFI